MRASAFAEGSAFEHDSSFRVLPLQLGALIGMRPHAGKRSCACSARSIPCGILARPPGCCRPGIPTCLSSHHQRLGQERHVACMRVAR
eukprot:10244024-Alexandrium_andersonii.AAC.1